ncbi:hypothetical protein COLO4_33771, partial [Corchorus olitorius]
MDLCLLRVHYQGFFVATDDSLRYEGGFVDDLYVDPDRLNWMELIGLLRRGGYRNIKDIFYKRQYFELFDGVKAVYNDKTVLEMVAEMVLEDEIDLYVEHGVEEPDDIAIHMIEGPPENVENGENADGQGGDDFVEVEVVQQRVEEDEERVQVDEERVQEDEERVQVDEERVEEDEERVQVDEDDSEFSEFDSDGESESVLSEYPDSD